MILPDGAELLANVKETGREGGDWIRLAKSRNQWLGPVVDNEPSCSIQLRNYWISQATISDSRGTLFHGIS